MIGRSIASLGSVAALILPLLVLPTLPASACTGKGFDELESSRMIEGFPFPDAIKGLPRGKMRKYTCVRSGESFSVRYGDEKRDWADVIVSDRVADIPRAGQMSIALEIELRIIELKRKLGSDEKVAILTKQIGAKTASMQLSHTYDGVEHQSFSFVMVIRKKIVKVKYTTVKRENAARRANAFRDYYFARLKAASKTKPRLNAQST
ncbi:hypothetical protein [Microvirga sp. 2TAF3]|uniref:hypothetical protein n=1 Tax=Microvirga sp. 2TAF3 TaxID=3233014 RepID=UPI003F9D3392